MRVDPGECVRDGVNLGADQTLQARGLSERLRRSHVIGPKLT
jgi:hypothetical protein